MPNHSVSYGNIKSLARHLGLLAALAVAVGCGNAEEGTVQLPAGTRERLGPQAAAPKGKDGAAGEVKSFSIKDPKNRPKAMPPAEPAAK